LNVAAARQSLLDGLVSFSTACNFAKRDGPDSVDWLYVTHSLVFFIDGALMELKDEKA
jgi:hypothetical protein